MSPRDRGSAPRRGEIWWVRFDPKVGAEIEKTRPAIVVSVDQLGKLALRIVVPVTHWKARYTPLPWLVHIAPSSANGLQKESAADCFQVKSVALERFQRRIGVLRSDELDEIAAGMALCVGYQ